MIKTVSQPEKSIQVVTEQQKFLLHADSANLDFNTFNAKGNAEIEMNGSKHSVTINIRIKKDHIIWAYFNLGFIPLGKAYITPDSIKFINMIQGGYIHKDFSYLKQFSSQAVDFKTLQNILVGNKTDSFVSASSIFSVLNSAYRLKSKDENLDMTLDFDQSFKPAEIFLQNLVKKQDLHVKYKDLEPMGGKLVPQTILLSSHVDSKSYTLNLSYHKITLNEDLEFPFNAPSGN